MPLNLFGLTGQSTWRQCQEALEWNKHESIYLALWIVHLLCQSPVLKSTPCKALAQVERVEKWCPGPFMENQSFEGPGSSILLWIIPPFYFPSGLYVSMS